MTSRILNANKAFIRHFIAIPDDELIHLAFSSYSRLCYIIISQVKVALALLDAVQMDAPSNPTSVSTFGNKDQSLAQLIITEVDYVNECTMLYQQLRRVCRVSFAVRHEQGCMEHFACVVKGMISSYEHHLRSLSVPVLDVGTQYPQLMINTGNAAEIYTDIADPESSISVGGSLGNRQSAALQEFVFDDSVWQSVMETFAMPV